MINILKPELLWIEGRCYRVNDSTANVSDFHEHDLYENEINYNDEQMEDEDDDFEVTMLDNSRYATNFHVSKHYIGSIIGKKGAIKARIERDTKTNIKIPKQGDAGDIYILGPTESNVKAARRRINLIVMSSRMKQRATHFISIPMNSEEIMNNFQIFKEQVLKECPSRGLEESLFIRPEKLHLTLGVMCLMDNEERLVASKLLAQAKENIVMPLLRDHLPLKIRLKGLSYMNDDPSQIDVLYGLVSEEGWSGSGLLQRLGDSLVDFYYKADTLKIGLKDLSYMNDDPSQIDVLYGLVSDEGWSASGFLQRLRGSLVDFYYKAGYMNRDHGRENIKLHVTLINSKYRSKSSSTLTPDDTPNRRTRETFDGSEILRKFEDFDFGVMELNEIHLSQRHSIGGDGYYQPTCVVACK